MSDSGAGRGRCPACDSEEVYHRKVAANGGYGPWLLQGLGGFLKQAKMNIYVCARCGRMALAADVEARNNLKDSPAWRKVR